MHLRMNEMVKAAQMIPILSTFFCRGLKDSLALLRLLPVLIAGSAYSFLKHIELPHEFTKCCRVDDVGYRAGDELRAKRPANGIE